MYEKSDFFYLPVDLVGISKVFCVMFTPLNSP